MEATWSRSYCCDSASVGLSPAQLCGLDSSSGYSDTVSINNQVQTLSPSGVPDKPGVLASTSAGNQLRLPMVLGLHALFPSPAPCLPGSPVVSLGIATGCSGRSVRLTLLTSHTHSLSYYTAYIVGFSSPLWDPAVTFQKAHSIHTANLERPTSYFESTHSCTVLLVSNDWLRSRPHAEPY